MSEATKIEWADHTWSPWRGCTKVSPGCANCYAETLSRRNPAVLGEWGKDGKRVINADWKKPLAWDRAAKRDGVRRRVFPSLCDVFEDRPDLDEPLARFFQLIHATPNLDWLILTKRPELFRRRVRAAADSTVGLDLGPVAAGLRLACSWLNDAPPSNVWLGVSVEDQARAAERIPELAEIPAAVRWLSVEPLIGPVNLTDWLEPVRTAKGDPDHPAVVIPGIDWCVVGGESGPNARPCDLAWIRSIVAQCRDAGVPVYVKQLGSEPFDSNGASGFPPAHEIHSGPPTYADVAALAITLELMTVNLQHPKGGNPAEWPKDLRVREYPKQAKGGQL